MDPIVSTKSLNNFELTPWNELSIEDQNYIINNQATDPSTSKYILPEQYINSSFYTKDGKLAKGTDVDKWLKQGVPLIKREYVPPIVQTLQNYPWVGITTLGNLNGENQINNNTDKILFQNFGNKYRLTIVFKNNLLK